MADRSVRGAAPSEGLGKKALRPLGAAGKVGKNPLKAKNPRREAAPAARRRLLSELSHPSGNPGIKPSRSGERHKASGDPIKKPGETLSKAIKGGPRMLRKILSAALVGLAAGAMILLLSGVALYGYFFFFETDYLVIKHHDIRGTFRVTRKEILEAAGLDRPVNMIRFDASKAVSGLKSLPWVEDANVFRKPLPDGVTIRVKEYKPQAVVSLGELYYMDRRGRPFKGLAPGENPDFPLVSGFTLDELLNEGPLARKKVDEIFELMDILSGRTDELRLDNVSEFNYDPDIGVTFFARTGRLEIRAGFPPFQEKMARLGKVFERLRGEGLLPHVEKVNLECAPRAVIRFARGKGPGKSEGDVAGQRERPTEILS